MNFIKLTQGLSWWTIHDDVDPQNLHRVQWIGDAHELRQCDERKSCNRRAQLESNEVPDVVENSFSLFDGSAVDKSHQRLQIASIPLLLLSFNSHNGVEIVVDENHVSCFLTHVGAIFAHRDANVGPFQGHAIIDAIASHSDDVAGV
jgi:hypothetical protein